MAFLTYEMIEKLGFGSEEQAKNYILANDTTNFPYLNLLKDEMDPIFEILSLRVWTQ